MFGFKKKKREIKDPLVLSLSFVQSKHFRGFKKIKIASHGYKLAEDGIASLANADLSETRIVLSVVEDDSPRIEVRASDIFIGSIWQSSWADYYNVIKSGAVEAVHVRIDGEEAYLFIKY